MSTNTVNGDALAEKLRRENWEQFIILVRMHLSFVLDLNTDESEAVNEKNKLKKWNFIPFNKKSKPNRGIMDGIPLTQEGICQVYQLIEFLKKEPNICAEGIFRRTGSLTRQQELKSLLNQGITVSLDNNVYSVHDCASVLKGFLAELPEPLLTDTHYPAHCQIAELCGVSQKPTQESRLLHALQLLLLLLPPENRILLKDVLDLLNLTASYESSNKMSADSLATLFTPHLLCPRNLTPEGLHVNSQTLSGIVSFMIKKSSELFQIPPKLAVDIKAYYSERERRKMLSPKKTCNESVSDNYAANTVYSFVDVERTAKENQSNPTETALAQLYAHIQSLPESSRKRKLVKQFNRQNGHGTPLQLLRTNVQKNKSLGSSIKKHLFQKGFSIASKKNGLSQQRASSEELLNSPLHGLTSRAKLFCTKCDTSADKSNDENVMKKLKKSNLSSENIKSELYDENTINEIKRSISDSNLSTDKNEQICNSYLTSTPACVPLCACPDMTFTPKDQNRTSMSPITRSTQRMSKAMQETMMTPRSRKPVLLVSGTNINNLPKLEIKDCDMDSVEEEEETSRHNSSIETKSMTKSKSATSIRELIVSQGNENVDSLTTTFREYLQNRSMLTATPTDLSFSSCTDDFCSAELNTSHMSSSLLHCLNGYNPEELNQSEAKSHSTNKDSENDSEKEFVLRPKQFDIDGKPIIYETSF